jgi:ubiquinone/menaquinone biosynthesis C-methylase UbiE
MRLAATDQDLCARQADAKCRRYGYPARQMSSSTDDLTLFEGAARYYAQFRPKYPKSVFEFITRRFSLERNARILDLGCGTGNASLPLATIVGEIIAMDPDPDMIAVGREIAEAANFRNVVWINGGSGDLAPSLGPVRLVCMGQSFHWMNRDQVLNDLYEIVEDGGGIVLIGPAHGLVLIGSGPPQPKESWQAAVDTVMTKYVGARSRHPRSNPSQPRHELALLHSRFAIGEYHEFESRQSLTPEDILGELYSMSGSLKKRLAERVGAFEADLASELHAMRADGRFERCLRTSVLVALKQ